MRRFRLLSLATSSVLWSMVALASTRPHYGGTLRVTMREAPQALDPASLVQSGASNVSRLIYDTLVVLDDRGQPQPSLAIAWQAEPGDQRWRISLRTGVFFSDGTKMDATSVAASLRAANPGWKVLAGTDTVVVQTAESDPNLSAELALPRNAIVRSGPQLSGTGPFTLLNWTPGKHLTLAANNQYWNGRPFLDSIEFDFGKNDHDQLTSLDLGTSDVAEIAPENIRRARADGRTVLTSSPSDLLALVFGSAPQSAEEVHLRNALALSVDTASINNVVLQGGGEPSGAIIPDWFSGYAFLFPSQPAPEQARQERFLAKQSSPVLLSYDGTDPVAHTIAERVLLNARDAGIILQLTATGHADVALVRIPLASLDLQSGLAEAAKFMQLPLPRETGASVIETYSAERALLQSHRIIPLIHLRTGIALRPNVRDFGVSADGSWRIDTTWIRVDKP